jgi:hypothetical protein
MNERIWDKFLTERDKAVFAAGGFGARAGFGDRPALLVVDVNWAFCGERPEPILESTPTPSRTRRVDAFTSVQLNDQSWLVRAGAWLWL